MSIKSLGFILANGNSGKGSQYLFPDISAEKKNPEISSSCSLNPQYMCKK